MDIGLFLLIFSNELDSFFDVANAPLTKDIEFFKAYSFGLIHIPLYYGHTFGG